MPATLDHLLDAAVIRGIARDLHAVHPPLDERAFVRDATRGLAELALMARGRHVAEVMRAHLPAAFPAAVRVLLAALPGSPALPRTHEPGASAFRYLPHTSYIAAYGLDHVEAALTAQHALTQVFTAEFSIRPFLERHPAATLARLRTWATDPSEHVRRLVSEGTRPRLPWASRLRGFQADPAPVLALLELLRDDPERYVQRSVANNLNDISKDHPELAVEVGRRWLEDAPAGRRWIVHHALRSLIKGGHAGALGAIGYAGAPRVTVTAPALTPRTVPLGGQLRFTFALTSTSAKAQDLLVDYAVHFVKASGAARPKVFKLKKLTLPGRAEITLGGTVSFAAMTTRTARPGRHRIDVLVNGVTFPLAAFDVRG